MGSIFYVMGKSASGKDTLYLEIKKAIAEINTVTLYTTRPIREGECDGVTYFFVEEEQCNRLNQSGRVIELRSYNTMHGYWNYFTVDDGQIDIDENSYLMIGTLESYKKTCEYFGQNIVVPIYIEVEDGERLQRALDREKNQKQPKYAELCRRFIADAEDFSQERLKKTGIKKIFYNYQLEECLDEIVLYIRGRI